MVSTKPITPAIEAFDEYPFEDKVVVYSLVLEDNGAPSKGKTYLRLPPPTKPYVLRISLDAGSAAAKEGVLYTNFPLDGSHFVRSRYHKTHLPQDFSKPFHIDLPITSAGAFEYFVEHASDGPSSARVKCTVGYFCVEPLLSIPARTSILSLDLTVLPPGVGGRVTTDTVQLPLNGLVIQTVIAKWMGTLHEWTPHLDLMRDRGYNMIHFTPLQQRGESGSPYSIYDQLEFDDELFPKGTKKADKPLLMQQFLKRIKQEWGMLGMMDVVLNHTANNSSWLEDHPEAGYNVVNSPHLEAAVELDTELLKFSASLKSRGLPTTLKTAADLDEIMSVITNDIYPSLKLYEYYVIDVVSETKSFSTAWTNETPPAPTGLFVELSTLPDRELSAAFAKICLPENWSYLGPRFKTRIDPSKAVGFIAALTGLTPGKSTLDEASMKLSKILDIINVPQYEKYDADRETALRNTKNRIKYTRLDDHGPKFGPVTENLPLVEPLFTRLPASLRTKKHDPRSLILANNGWIWDANPLEDFCSESSHTYIRRDLIVWGDCVKLRYGTGPSANPWLWRHMTSYVEQLAGMFDGFRLDNSHSTPIHVGEILLDAARRVNPNLYICAELFTGSKELDLLFVCRLGLNSLIREAMNSDDPKKESELLYSYGVGKPIGSMDTDCLTEVSTVVLHGRNLPCKIIPLPGSTPHAFLMDCTHDNESPLSKRTAEDALPTGALVTFAASAIGSNRGFDDLYPLLLDVVSEKRKYEVYGGKDNGIGGIKRLLNHLHTELVLNDGVEGHFSQEGDYITSHRVNPVTHQGYLLIAHTAFPGSSGRDSVAPIRLDGTQVKYIAGATVKISSTESRNTETTLRGLDAELLPITGVVATAKKDGSGSYTEIDVPDSFPPGSVMVFATWMEGLSSNLDAVCAAGATEAFAELDMVDLNPVLFRADGEERDALGGDGVYTVPGLGPLKYCGFQGWMPAVRHIMVHNDLGHPLCAHLRDGPWALDYVHARLEKQIEHFPRLAKPAAWLKERFDEIKATVPAFLRPKYFSMVINVAYKAARDRAIEQCATSIQDGNDFVQALALTSVQMYGEVGSASLDPFKIVPSLAAGLPHFTTGWARTWGRDVFISLRGLFLVTGQFDAAKDHILAFCKVLKHGLIPNLLDSGKTPRYNSRDSPWFMLQNIQDYVSMAPNGISILQESVKRRFPLDDEWVPFDDPKAFAVSSTVSDIIQEILQRHASGIHFREYNAGPNLDMQMTDHGFDIDIEVDWKTGIIFGGNEWNCGTWMDKMGESERAGTRGWPGTPRDGAPIEIIGLLKSTLRWVEELSSKGLFPHKGVQAIIDGKSRTVTYKEWNDLLQANFERCFYVPSDPAKDADYVIHPTVVARRGIYKDIFGSGSGRERFDYQLRANSAVAMTVAPELFTPAYAHAALKTYETVLLGPLGVKTLDPADQDYRGYYDNSNDSDDKSVAKGRNYHQGPEWVWPIGYFLRAYLLFDTTKDGAGYTDPLQTHHHIYRILSKHRAFMQSDPWAGLPELTNENGQECYDSCRTQAWSSSTILDVLDEIFHSST